MQKHRFNDTGTVHSYPVPGTSYFAAVHEESRMCGRGNTRMAAIFDLCQKMRRADMFSGSAE